MFTLLVIAMLVNFCKGECSVDQKKIEFLKWPPAKIKVLTGSTVELVWQYRVDPKHRLAATSWYFHTAVQNRIDKVKIIHNNHLKEGEPTINILLDPEMKNRSSCIFHKNDEDIWTMKCKLVKTVVDDSASYGIEVEMKDMNQKCANKQNHSSLQVVDIVLDRKASDAVVESWIGRKTELTCAIHKLTNLTTRYEWTMVINNIDDKDITRGITSEFNKTSYIFMPVSKRDFGTYKCKIGTRSTKEEHTILLKQIDYAKAPRDLQAVLQSNRKQSVRLFWNQPLHNGGTKIIDYVIKLQLQNSETWREIGSTTRLSVAVNDLENYDQSHIRVCSRNKVGIGPNSCTATLIKIAQKSRKQTDFSCSSTLNFQYLWLVLLIFALT